MISLSIGLFLVGVVTLVPFITWVIKVTAVPEQKVGGSNKPLRISESFKQLFGMTPNVTSWAVVMSLITGFVCLLYSIILAFAPIQKTMDFVLAGILVIITIPSLVAFASSVKYMQTDMFSGAFERLKVFFTTGNVQYFDWWISRPLIFTFSAVGTMLSSLMFLYVSYYLVTRQPVSYIQIAGKRRR